MARARLLARARNFFAGRGIVEVETPLLVSHAVTDPALANLQVRMAAPARSAWLHTSPEFHMKRLLAAGAPDIYQLGKVFRDGESGRRHEPEFTLVEWYRRGFDLAAMAAETCDLIRELAAGADPGPPARTSYAGLFAAVTGVDPLHATAASLAGRATSLLGQSVTGALANSLGTDADAWQDLLMSHAVIPSLAGRGLTVVERYPASQAALARLTPGDPRTAERFEVFWDDVELANGYHELGDAREQARRFERDREKRRERSLPDRKGDPRLLAALAAGLPDCAGVALGFDRLVMRILGKSTLREVISFAAPEG